MNKFEVSNMDLYYGSFHALKNININIPEREITAFIGPSGCGKSTFLKSLNRMNDLVEGCRISGDIKLDGVDIYKDKMDVNVLRKRVGMVFQKPNPFPMSIYDNIAADVVKRCEIIAHQGQRQRRFTTAGLTYQT